MGSLADRAGISKPVVYEHFRTRSGLLIALYRQIDDRQVKVLVEAVSRARRRLGDVAGIMAAAYMHCYTEVRARVARDFSGAERRVCGDAAVSQHQSGLAALRAMNGHVVVGGAPSDRGKRGN